MEDVLEKVLSKEDIEILNSGGKIPCPYHHCGGIIRKIPLNGDIFYTDFDSEASNEYVCSKNKKHFWSPFRLIS